MSTAQHPAPAPMDHRRTAEDAIELLARAAWQALAVGDRDTADRYAAVSVNLARITDTIDTTGTAFADLADHPGITRITIDASTSTGHVEFTNGSALDWEVTTGHDTAANLDGRAYAWQMTGPAAVVRAGEFVANGEAWSVDQLRKTITSAAAA